MTEGKVAYINSDTGRIAGPRLETQMDAPEPVKNESKPEAHKSGGSLRDWIGLLGGGMLLLLAAALFGIGRAYRAGYLSELGLDALQVQEDFHGYLYWGYLGLTPRLLSWLGGLVIALLIYAFLAWAIDRLAKNVRWISRVREWWSTFPGQGKASAHERLAAFAYLTFVLALMVFLTYAAMVQTHQDGIERGSKEIEKLRSSAGAASNRQWIAIHFDAGRIESGYRLLCTDKLCSIYDPRPDGGMIKVVPLDGLKEIRVLEPPAPPAATAKPST